MMNIDRLLLRINAVLDGAAEGFEARALASEYAALAESVRDRMRQCASLIKAGNDNAALQVAEAPPPVLDLAAALAFERSPAWREYCKEHRLPLAHKLEETLIEQVNSLYSKEIGESHPLYRDYRAAMRERDDLKALGVLRSIARVNSADKNAREEFERLSGKLRREMLARLRSAREHGQDNEVFGIMSEMEHAGLAPCPDSSEWNEASRMRDAWEAKRALGEAILLIPQIIVLRDAGEWEGAIPLLGKARAMEKRYGFRWPAEEGKLLAHTEAWVESHSTVVEKLRREEEKTEDLYRRLDEMEKRLTGKARSREFIVADLATAESWIGEAEALPESANFHAPLVRARHVRSKLKAELHRRRNRTLAIATLCAASAAGIVITGAVMSQNAAAEREFRTGLERAEAAPTQRPVLEFLAGPARRHPDLARSAENAARVSALKTRSDRADALRRSLAEEAAAVIKAASGKSPAVNALRERVAALPAALEQLPTDLAAEVRPECDAARLAVDELSLNAPADRLESLMRTAPADLFESPEFIELKASLSAALEAPGSARQVCLNRARATLALVESAAGLQRARTEAFRKLELADSLATHLAAMEALSALEDGTRETTAARRVCAAASELQSDLLSKVATPAGRAMLSAAKTSAETPSFVAAEPTAGETAAAGRIAALTRFAGVWRAVKVTYTTTGKSLTPILIKAQPQFESLDLAGGTETRVKAETVATDGTSSKALFIMRQFNGRQPTGETLESAQASREGELLASLKSFYDTDRSAFGEAPLAALDRVVASKADPLLKAWLHRELLAVMAERPGEWGLAFSPEAAADAARLRALPIAPPEASTWMKAEGLAEPRKRLSEFYAEKRAPYLPAAAQRGAQAKALASARIAYAGRTDADAKPGPVAGTPGERLIGLTAEGKAAVLGAIARDGSASLTRRPAAYSPLLRVALPTPEGAKAPEASTPPDDDWLTRFLPKP